MAKSRGTKKRASSGRGSAQAIAKRRAARHLNTLFGKGSQTPLDGRTAKRRKRLLGELRDGRRGRPLKAIEVLTHTNELLALGETLGTLRKAGIKPLRVELGDDEMRLVLRTQQEYGFRPEAWKMLGIDLGNAKPKKS